MKVIIQKYLSRIAIVSLIALNAQLSFGQCPTGAGTISGSNAVCNLSTSINYTVTGFTGSISSYNWSVPSGVVITSGTSTNIITVSISGSAVSGTIKAFAINASPCTLPGIAFNLTVNPLPTVSISGATNLCTGQTAFNVAYINSVNSPDQYKVDWNSAANSAGLVDDVSWNSLTGGNMTISGIATTTPGGNYTGALYIRNSLTGCQSDVSSQSFCGTTNENTTLVMTSPSGKAFTAINFASFGTPNGSCGSYTIGGCHAPTSLAVVQAAGIGQTSFSVPATNGNFGGDPCSGTAKRLYIDAVYPAFYLTITPSVASITTSATTICSGFTTTLTASAGVSYSWSPGGATTQSIVVSPASTQTYNVTVTSSSPSCSITGANQTITVNQLPTLTSLTSSALVCYGTNSLNLSFTGTSFSPDQYSFVWSSSAHTAGLTDIGWTTFSSSPIIVPLATVTSGTYGGSVLVRNSTTGCQYTIFGQTTVCGTTNENTTLVMTAPGGALFTAVNFASFGTPNGTCGAYTIGACHAPISLTYVQSLAIGRNSFSVSATNGNFGGDPCSGTAKRLYIQAECSGFVLTVNSALSMSSSLTASSCTGSTFSYTPTSSTTGVTFAWSRATVTGITNTSNSGMGSISEVLVNTTTSPIAVNYAYIVSSNGCNSSIQNLTLTSNPAPGTISGISGSSSLCNYQTGITYSVNTVVGATSYLWTVPSGMVVLSGSTTSTITVSVSGIFQGGNIISSARNSCGTVTSAAFSVTANSFTSSLYSGLLVNYNFNNSVSDYSGNLNNAILQGSPSYTTDRNGNASSAISFNGTTAQYATSTTLISTAPANYSFALWFKTTSLQGGKLIGYGSNPTGNSGSFDRHLYMLNTGQITFGNYSASAPSILTTSTPLAYNDGNWHHVSGTYSTATGISIYMDGKLVTTIATNGTYNYSGYWRIGGDNVAGWTSAPTSNYFNGAIDELYVYNRELTANEVSLLYGITDNSPVCSSSNLIMSVGTYPGASYAWTGPASFTASAYSSSISGVSTVNSGLYTASISVAGCSISTSKTITIDASVTNSITGAQNICVGQIPLDALSGIALPANASYTYLWEISTITGGMSGYLAAPGVNTGTGYTFTTAINTNTYVRRSLFPEQLYLLQQHTVDDGYSPNLSAPNFYPTNAWYSYVYNAQSWPNANYAGLWTLAGSNINVDTRTTVTGYGSWTNRPSQAINYTGCQVNNINYSLDVKRTGFNGGIYQIDMLAYDDATYLLINGTQFWSDPNWFNNVPKYAVYVGPLTSTTSLQLRLNQGGGGGGFAFNVFSTTPGTLLGGTIGSSQSVCAGNTPDPFTNVTLPSSGCSVGSYTWQYSNTDTVTGWNDIASSNNSTYTYPLSIGQTTYFRRKVTDICGTSAYSNIVTVDNNYVPLISPTVAGTNGWNAFMYYDQTFGSYAGYFTMSGINTTNLGFNTVNYFASGTAPSTYAQYNGCNIGANNISGKFLRTNFPSAIYQLDITGHDDDAYVIVNGVQVFVHNGCCDTHSSVYQGLLGPSDVVEVRWQQGTGGSYMQIALTTTTSTTITAGTLTPTSVSACTGDIPPQSITTASVTSGCTIIAYQWQQSTVSGTSGFSNISGATSNTLTPNFAISGTTYIRRIDTDACGQSATLSGVVFTVGGVTPGDTSVYGNNIWNSYGYNCYTGANGSQVASAANFSNYRGYATIAGTSFLTTTLYTSGTQSPSNISGYQGCSLLPSQHSTRTKRKGFPAGQYNILLSYDDPGAVLVNNVLVYSAACCAANANTGWSGNLGSNDLVEIRQSQNNGGSYYGITLNPATVTGLSGVGSIGVDQVVCYSATGIAVNSISPATSGGCFITYQFQSSTTPGFTASIVTLSGFTTNTSITGLGPFTQTTYIRRLALDACGGGAASNIITISVPGLVTPGSINTVAGVCSGSAPTTITSASLPSGGIGTYTYVWQSSPDNAIWTSIASATGVNYPQPNAISVPTYFRRSVTSGSCVSTATSSILVSLNAVTTITSQPSNTTVCNGSIALFSAVTGGVSTSNQWQISTSGGVYFNLTNNQVIATSTISGVTANALSISGVNSSLTGYLFRLLVNGSCGANITSTSVNISIGGPSVTTQPVNNNICLGSNAVFSFATSGVATNYLWYQSTNSGANYNVIVNNATYSGVSTSILTVNGLSSSMTGYRYLCNVTTSCNTFATSTTVGILTVTSAISNNTITGTSTICGSTATTITGTTATGGGGVYTYLWQSSPDGAAWTNITTATSINYTTPPLTTTTFYKRIITSGSGCTDANNSIQISITQTASIVTQPSTVNVCANGIARINTTATGAGLTYSWVESISGWNPVDISTGIYSGYNSSSLTITGAPLSISGRQFKCIVTGSCNVVTTNGVNVTILTAPVIVTNPSGYITCANSLSPIFVASATGTSITYQWQVSTDNGFSYGYVPGIAPYTWAPDTRLTNSLAMAGGPVPASYNGYVYRVEVSGTCAPKAYSTGAVLTVNSAIANNSIATSQTLCQGTPSTLTGTVAPTLTGGDGTYVYKWQTAPDNTTWVDINPTVTSANFAPPFLSSTTYYRRIVSSFDCPVSASSSVTIAITPGTSVTGSPVNASVCENTNASFSVAAAGNSLSYQWQYATSTVSGGNWQDLTPVVGGVVINGVTSTAMTVVNAPPSFNGYLFRAVVSGNCTPLQATSTGVSLTTNPAPTIVQNPSNTAVCINGNAQFNTSATGTGIINYTWKESTGAGFNLLADGGIYSNTSTTSINISSVPLNYSGRQYMAIAAVGGCTISSTGANITVNQPTSITSSLTRNICGGSFLNYSVTASVFGSTINWDRPTVAGISNAAGSGSSSSIVEQLFNSTSLPVNVFYNLNPVGPMPTTCSGTGAVLTVTVFPGAGGSWGGNVNSDWFNSGNWCGGIVPTSGISASVFTGSLFYPVITTSGALCLDLSIGAGALLSITGANTLGVYGNYTNNGTFVPSNTSALNFQSTTQAQTITGTSVTTFTNLTISNTASGGVSLKSIAKISNTLTLGANSKLVTTGTGSSLIFISNTLIGTARIASIPSNATIVGNIVVQRFIPAKLAFRFLASPVIGATISQWQGTMLITGNGAGSDGGSLLPTVYNYAESFAGVQNIGFQKIIAGTSTVLQQGAGYRVFVRGDRSINLTGVYAATQTTLSVTGTPNIGTVTLPVTYTSTPGGNVSMDGWNLVGNPYVSQIDWNLVTTGGANFQNIDNALYILDPVSTSNTTAGSYMTYVNGVAAGPSSSSNPNLISSSQAFFVHANAANPVLRITESMKSSGTVNNHFRNSEISDLLRITLAGASGEDNTAIRFLDGATDLFDSYTDAYKLANSNASISSIPVNGLDLSINTMRVMNDDARTVPLNIATAVNGSHKLVFNNIGTFDPNIKIDLVDKYLNITQSISEDFNYDFVTTSIAGSKGNNRFEILFSPQYGSVTTDLLPDSLQNADLKWSIDGNWYANNEIASHLTVGTYTVAFATIPGWYAPANRKVTVMAGSTVSVTGMYVAKPKIGSIIVNLTPKNIDRGRIKTQWRINKGAWQNSDIRMDSILVGSYSISFNEVYGYTKPVDVTISIVDGLVTTLTSEYLALSDSAVEPVVNLPLETISGIDLSSNIIDLDSTSNNTFAITAYPNPVGDNVLTLKMKGFTSEKVVLEVYNQAGIQVYTKNLKPLSSSLLLSEAKLDIFKDLPNGIYLLKFVQNEKVYLKKVAK